MFKTCRVPGCRYKEALGAGECIDGVCGACTRNMEVWLRFARPELSAAWDRVRNRDAGSSDWQRDAFLARPEWLVAVDEWLATLPAVVEQPSA